MITIDDSYTILPDKIRGRKPKFKVRKDNKTYIYKYGAINYEIWAELIAEQLGRQVGIDMAHYEIATFENTVGLLTDYFLSEGELIISSDTLKNAIQNVLSENSIHSNFKNNSLENIIQAAFVYDSQVNTQTLTYELTKRWAFYGLIMESDKNETNIGFIKGTDKALHLTPDYDNSTMACLNENITHFIDSMREGYPIYHFTDQIESSLKRSEKDTGNFLEDFKRFADRHPDMCESILNSFATLNIEQAIENVEQINQVDVPWEVKYWLDHSIDIRKKDMENIFARSQQKKKSIN